MDVDLFLSVLVTIHQSSSLLFFLFSFPTTTSSLCCHSLTPPWTIRAIYLFSSWCVCLAFFSCAKTLKAPTSIYDRPELNDSRTTTATTTSSIIKISVGRRHDRRPFDDDSSDKNLVKKKKNIKERGICEAQQLHMERNKRK